MVAQYIVALAGIAGFVFAVLSHPDIRRRVRLPDLRKVARWIRNVRHHDISEDK